MPHVARFVEPNLVSSSGVLAREWPRAAGPPLHPRGLCRHDAVAVICLGFRVKSSVFRTEPELTDKDPLRPWVFR